MNLEVEHQHVEQQVSLQVAMRVMGDRIRTIASSRMDSTILPSLTRQVILPTHQQVSLVSPPTTAMKLQSLLVLLPYLPFDQAKLHPLTKPFPPRLLPLYNFLRLLKRCRPPKASIYPILPLPPFDQIPRLPRIVSVVPLLPLALL